MIEKKIKITADTGEATKNVDKLTKSVEKTDEATGELTGSIDAMTGGAVTKFKGMVGSLKAVAGGFKSVGAAIAISGLGLLVLTISSLVAAFKSSEEGQNKFAKIMTVIGAVTGNFVDLLADLGEKIIEVFENPKQALQDFGDLLKQNVINRFEGILEFVPAIAKSIKLLFKGEWKEAGKVAADAAGKMILGVEGITEKVDGAIDSVKKFTKEQIKEGKAAASVAEMRARADKIDRKLLVERSKLEAEVAELRLKSRMDDEYSAEQRKQFLEEANDLQEQLLSKEETAKQLRYEAQKLENTFSRSNKENLDKEAQAEADLNNIRTRRLNEQRMLQREVQRVDRQIAAEKNEEVKAEEERNKNILKIQSDYALKIQDLEDKTEAEKIKRQEERALAELDALKATEAQKAEVKKYYADLIAKDEEERAKKAAELEEQKKMITVGLASQTSALIGEIVNKDSKAGKAVAIGQATIAGFEAVLNTFSTASKSPVTSIFPAYPYIQSGLAGAFAAVQIAKIKSSSPVGESAGTVSSQGNTGRTAPSFNLVAGTGTDQINQGFRASSEKPVKAYVVSTEVSTAQELDRKAVDEAYL